MRELLREWASGAGYRVHSRAALGARIEPDVNLVVVDLVDLPTRGSWIVSQVKRLSPAAAVVGISTQLTRALSAGALQALVPGLAALCPKPCSRGELLAAVAQALA